MIIATLHKFTQYSHVAPKHRVQLELETSLGKALIEGGDYFHI